MQAEERWDIRRGPTDDYHLMPTGTVTTMALTPGKLQTQIGKDEDLGAMLLQLYAV